eukprot:NODE_76_length_23837_cov_1.242396.p1 type:complete len:824 gc:universal NODE_76_length_23837_cov_1.242396:5881-8352(+)
MLLSEDLILIKNWIGIVENTPYSSDEDDDESDNEDWEDDISCKNIPLTKKSKLQPYTVGWLSHRAYPKTSHSENDVQLLDRAVCKGDVVQYQNQLGTVLDVHCFYDVMDHMCWLDPENGNEFILKNVPSSALYRDHEYLLNENIFLGDYMGTLEDLSMDCIVCIKYLGFSSLMLVDEDLCQPVDKKFDLKFSTTLPSHDRRIEVEFKHGYNHCYSNSYLNEATTPGTFFELQPILNAVKNNNSRVKFLDERLKSKPVPKWMTEFDSEDSSVQVICLGLKPRLAEVEWVLKNPFSVENSYNPPETQLNLENEIVHQKIVPLIPLNLRKNFLPGTYCRKDNVYYEVINVRSYVDIELQSSKIVKAVKSTEIKPTLFVNDEDYLPSDFVKNKNDPDSLGIVIEANEKERVCRIRWFEDGYNFGKLLPDIQEISLFDCKDGEIPFMITSGCFLNPNNIPDSICKDLKLLWFGEINNISKTSGALTIKFHNGTEHIFEPNEVVPFIPELLDYFRNENEESEEDNEEDEWETDEEIDVDPSKKSSRNSKNTSRSQSKTVSRSESAQVILSQELFLDNRDSENRVLFDEDPPTDHHFLNSSHKHTKKLLKRYQHEMQLLKSNLAPGIIVKCYESRIDLYRCMIIGPQETPYEDTCFFFDVYLDESYPSQPPMVHYRSFSDGKQLNPNLFDEGKVCISLLGTTTGENFEMWNEKQSSLLQLFVSIQALILTKDPFWNEPLHWRLKDSAEGDRSKTLYFERTVIGCLISISNILKNPIAGFEKEIKHHFIELKALSKTLTRVEQYLSNDLPKGYKLSLEKIKKDLLLLSEKE